MAMTDQQKTDAARELANEIFVLLEVTSHSNLDDLKEAVGSVDTAMDMVINDIPGAWGAKPIKQALLDNLPDPFKTNATNKQKAFVMAYWAFKEANLI